MGKQFINGSSLGMHISMAIKRMYFAPSSIRLDEIFMWIEWAHKVRKSIENYLQFVVLSLIKQHAQPAIINYLTCKTRWLSFLPTTKPYQNGIATHWQHKLLPNKWFIENRYQRAIVSCAFCCAINRIRNEIITCLLWSGLRWLGPMDAPHCSLSFHLHILWC